MRGRATVAAALLLPLVLAAAAPAGADSSVFHSGACEASALGVHAWHEFGHDLAAYAAGDHPLAGGALWGNKWDETQTNFRRIAIGGLLMQIVMAAIDASFEDDPAARCAVTMNAVGAGAYALRVQLAPTQGGDYDPFTTSGRNLITVASVGGIMLLDTLADTPTFGRSLFAGLPAGGPPADLVPLSGEVADDAPVRPSLFATLRPRPFAFPAGEPVLEALAGLLEEGADDFPSALPAGVEPAAEPAPPPPLPLLPVAAPGRRQGTQIEHQ